MALITIETQTAFLQKVFIDYIALWKKCFNNLNNILIQDLIYNIVILYASQG